MGTEQKDTSKIVAFIDLLGTKNRIKKNSKGDFFDALRPIINCNHITYSKIYEGIAHPSESYDKELRVSAKNNLMDSFDFFLPFSDSIFIMSNDCCSFIKQLGNYIFGLYNSTIDFYKKDFYMRPSNNPSEPEKVKMPTLSLGKNGKIKIKNRVCDYYPALFRGGISFGKACSIELYSIVNKKPSKSTTIAGKAVSDAVELEGKIKGPRLVFGKKVYNQLDKDTRDYCRIVPEKKGLYEILWPAFNYYKRCNPSNNELKIEEIKRLLDPTYNLWKAYNHTEYSNHYFNLIELIIASTIQFFDKKCQLKSLAVDEIYEWLNNNELQHKIDIKKY